MSTGRGGSRLRYLAYRAGRETLATEATRTGGIWQGRHRPAVELLRAFWALLAGLRWPIALSLLAAALGSLLRLVPPVATGVALDTVLGQRRVPDALTRFGVTPSPPQLLTAIALGLITLAVLSALVSTAGTRIGLRDQATKTAIAVERSGNRPSGAGRLEPDTLSPPELSA